MGKRKFNKYTNHGSYCEMHTEKAIIYIDSEDIDRVIQNSHWCSIYNKKHNRWEIIGHEPKTRKTIRLHRFIMKVIDPTTQVDHKNHNTLDNRKENLRLTTNKENQENRKESRNGSVLGIRGITINIAKGGKTYYKANVTHNYVHQSKYFPYTSDGLDQAKNWVQTTRLKLFTHSDGR